MWQVSRIEFLKKFLKTILLLWHHRPPTVVVYIQGSIEDFASQNRSHSISRILNQKPDINMGFTMNIVEYVFISLTKMSVNIAYHRNTSLIALSGQRDRVLANIIDNFHQNGDYHSYQHTFHRIHFCFFFI